MSETKRRLLAILLGTVATVYIVVSFMAGAYLINYDVVIGFSVMFSSLFILMGIWLTTEIKDWLDERQNC